jgi:predicted XRE-type DNA-binding protein
VIYALQIDDIWVLHAFQKKSRSGIKTPKAEIALIDERLKRLREATMSKDEFDIIRGSGNVFRDLCHPDADREQLRELLAARIIGVLDDRKLTVRAAHELTGFAAADFSRIRQAKLDRFTIDRLMVILAGLGQQVDVTVEVHPRRAKTKAVELRP